MVENKSFAKHFRYRPICLDTLMKYTDGLTKVVKNKIDSIFSEKFALVFDGWSSCNTKFIAIIPTFPVENENVFSQVLLGLTPRGDESSLDAEKHLSLKEVFLSVYGNDRQNVICIDRRQLLNK